MNARVYVAAPYADAPAVRELHELLRALGFTCTSAWAEVANGPDDLEALSEGERAATIIANDTAVAVSNVVVALVRDGAGGEMFAELRLADLLDIPIVWVGTRRTLSAYREGVTRVAAIDDALEVLMELTGRPRCDATEPRSEHVDDHAG